MRAEDKKYAGQIFVNSTINEYFCQIKFGKLINNY